MNKLKPWQENLAIYGGSTIACLGVFATLYFAFGDVDRSKPVVVYEKEYDDPDKETTFLGGGKTIYIDTQIDPEHFNLLYKQCGHNPAKVNVDEEGCYRGVISVSSNEFASTNIGDELMLPSLQK